MSQTPTFPVEVARPGRYVLLGVARREPVAG